MPRKVKTWLRANRNQQKFNRVAAILQTNKTSTDKIWLIEEANEFA